MSKNDKEKKETGIDNVIENAFSHIKEIVDANTVVGKMIELGNKMFLIPVSKISVGLISGGGSNSKDKSGNLSAGSGTGFNIVPIGFIAISNLDFKFLPVNTTGDMSKKILDMLFEFYENYIAKKGEKQDEKE